MRTIRIFARILIGPVFIISGFAKAIDPLGSTYKFSDYFEAFGMEFMQPLAFSFAVLLSVAELVVGLNLLLGNFMKFTAWALLIFNIFFTILTFFLAMFNLVTDCGCFGDLWVLTNWQTFWKNVVFMLPTLIVFFNRRYYKPMASYGSEFATSLLFVLITVFLIIGGYSNLPFIDFRPYHVGAHIPSSMTIPEGEAVDEYEAIFIYEKDGKQEEFTPENIPYQDTAWKYVDRKTKLVKKGYEPPIHDFSIGTFGGMDISDSVLGDKGYSLLVVSYKLDKANDRGLEKVNAFVESLDTASTKVYGLTATPEREVDKISREKAINYDFHITDETQLKTIVRSNPGVLLLKEGTIIGKWHFNNLPDLSNKEANLLSVSLSDAEKNLGKWIYWFFAMFLAALMLFLVMAMHSNRD